MRKAKWILGLLIAATLLFVWGNSLKSREESADRSDYVLAVVRPVIEPILGPEGMERFDIRKCAHFVEFTALGAELALLAWRAARPRLQRFVNALSFGLAAAVTDESIQIFSGRGPLVQDVLLDFAGVLAGMLIMSAVYHCVRLLRQRAKHGMISP